MTAFLKIITATNVKLGNKSLCRCEIVLLKYQNYLHAQKEILVKENRCNNEKSQFFQIHADISNF